MKRTRIRTMSDKMREQKAREWELREILYDNQRGRCARCNKRLSYGWYSKHEINRRSAGGDPLDINNCELLCTICHTDVTEYRNPNDKGVHRE